LNQHGQDFNGYSNSKETAARLGARIAPAQLGGAVNKERFKVLPVFRQVAGERAHPSALACGQNHSFCHVDGFPACKNGLKILRTFTRSCPMMRQADVK
jgi:hypothetical protein